MLCTRTEAGHYHMAHVLGKFSHKIRLQNRARLICDDRVGVGGHATHGGYGLTSRMWGMTLDKIVQLDVVLPDGTITTLSQTANPDLFWVRWIQVTGFSQPI